MIQALILAAGQGKRMRSDLPKVLHCLAGKPLLEHVLCTAQRLAPTISPIVVCGHEADRLKEALRHYSIHWVEQAQQLGTGHAVEQAMSHITADRNILILYGDVPLVSESSLRLLMQKTDEKSVGMLTAKLSNPYGYGRIVRNESGDVVKVVEEKDADDKQRDITEVNTGIYLLPGAYLRQWLAALDNNNAQGEYYLTDIISMAAQDGVAIQTVCAAEPEEIAGVNNRKQLMTLERYYQRQQADRLLEQGVSLYDAGRLDIRGELIAGHDVVIDVNVVVEGRVVIGNHCIIGPNVILRNAQLGDHVVVKANTVIEGAEIAASAEVGPFARIRPGTVLAKDVHVGNFVEIKNSEIGELSKINHLSYVGDALVGQQVNIGAGTITCNYDGANKHKTVIGDDVHIGSDSQLIAPVSIGQGVTIAAGSTIVSDVEPDQLVLTQRLDQRGIKNWKRPQKVKTADKQN